MPVEKIEPRFDLEVMYLDRLPACLCIYVALEDATAGDEAETQAATRSLDECPDGIYESPAMLMIPISMECRALDISSGIERTLPSHGDTEPRICGVGSL